MARVYSYDLTQDFISHIAGYMEENYFYGDRDLSRLAVVFGGRRPALFLKRELSRRIKKSFYPPVFFSIDQLVEKIVLEKGAFSVISDLDACFIIYNLARRIAPGVLKARETFALFLPWAREILRFIEQLDLEGVDIHSLEDIQLHADIGYDVPESINALLSKIVMLARDYHQTLLNQKSYSRGLMYRLASEYIQETPFEGFDDILFCNFFYLHRTEENIIKNLYERQKALLFFQGSSDDWSVLKRVSKSLSVPIMPSCARLPEYTLSIQAGSDVHAQVCLVREILKKIDSFEKTVIVLPEPEHLVALLSEISYLNKDFNVSMGYPLTRSLLYSFFELLFKAQETKKDGRYYTKDYLRLLSHPLVKNLALSFPGAVTRILVHGIEECLTGVEKSLLSGSLFIDLAGVEDLKGLYESVHETISGMGVEEVEIDCLKEGVRQLHHLLFYAWGNVGHLYDFACHCENWLDVLVQKSIFANYPFNLKAAEKVFSILSELKNAGFSREPFLLEGCFNVFKNKLEHEAMAFNGSPLKGLQILGLFETRCLNFENVIIMDVNESMLPKLKVYEPLVPRDVMIGLGLNRLEKEEEIQRYQFTRLISHAKNVFLIFQEGLDKEKSRFIEDLVWRRQQACGQLDAVSIHRAAFQVKVPAHKMKIAKTPEQAAFLRQRCYSASSIDTYLHCPLRFYYHYVLGLREKQELAAGPQAGDIGNFVHELLEEAFKKFIGKEPVIDAGFRKYFRGLFEKLFDEKIAALMRSDAFLVREVLKYRLEKFLDYEQARRVAEILFLEKKFEEIIVLGDARFRFECRMDRVDRLFDESLLIIDYKTGSTDVKPANNFSYETLSRGLIKENIKSFQLPLYIHFLKKEFNEARVNAALLNLRELDNQSYLKKFFAGDSLEKEHEIMGVFKEALGYIMNQILDASVPFEADESAPHRCARCPFFYLCR